MPVIFSTGRGTVAQLADPAEQCDIRIKIEPDVSFESHKSIVTRLTIHQEVNLQFLHTLGAMVYVYVFGDRMGSVSLSGLSFACTCSEGGGSSSSSGGSSGAEKMLEWYKQARASRRQEPITVTIGDQVIEGFVTSFNEDVVDTAAKLIQWQVDMSSLPGGA